jgi:hypothetical protein
MDSNHIETVIGLVVANRDVQGAVGFLHPHEQTLGKGFGSRALLNNLSLGQYPSGIFSGNAAFLCPEECMIAPRNASGAGCGSNTQN